MEVAKFVRNSGGSVSRKHLEEKGYSNRQLKQMICGEHPLLELRGNDLVLTELGEKAVAIALEARSGTPGGRIGA